MQNNRTKRPAVQKHSCNILTFSYAPEWSCLQLTFITNNLMIKYCYIPNHDHIYIRKFNVLFALQSKYTQGNIIRRIRSNIL